MNGYHFTAFRRDGFNSYLAACSASRECMVVDPFSAEAAGEEMARLGLELRHVVLTHGREQLRAGAEALIERTGTGRICLHPGNALFRQGDRELQHDDWLILGMLRVRVVGVPGACPGGIGLYLPFGPGEAGSVLSGTALLAGRIGDTPDPESAEILRKSLLEHLIPLGDAVRVYPATGPQTTVGIERHYNPFLE